MARQPAAVRERVGLVAVAVEPVIDGVIDPLVVPPPAFEAAWIPVLDPADLTPADIDDLILSMAAAARPCGGIAQQVSQDVDGCRRVGRAGRTRAGNERERQQGSDG